MAVVLDDVLAYLDSEEPDYERAAQLGPEALPYLIQIINNDDPMRASKAVYLAARIDDGLSQQALTDALRNSNPIVRVAVAGAARNFSGESRDLLLRLLDDNDSGVRKVALRSIDELRPTGMHSKVQQIAENDPQESLRLLAARTTRNLPDAPR